MIIQKTIVYRGSEINVSDLKPSSEFKVLVMCDSCQKERMAFYKSVKDNQTCHSCTMKISRSNPLKKGDVFGRLEIIQPIYNKSICKCSCGNILIVTNDNLRRGHTNSCGCLQKEKAHETAVNIFSKLTGENHPNWKGGISSKRNRFQATNEYSDWRLSVLTRDGFKCQKCGSESIINTHHIIPYSKDETIALDIENGIVLCNDCHRKYHHIYGHKNANKETLKEFLS